MKFNKKIDSISSTSKALEWIKENTLDEKGIIISSRQKSPYLEVTGYLIPTLMEAGEFDLAWQYAEFLSYMQRSNGSFAGPDGREYIFDSGQALRGLVGAAARWEKFKPFAQKTADYLVSSMHSDGRLPAIYNDDIPEAVHVFVLPALVEAATLFKEPRYLEASQRALHFYKKTPDVLNKRCLTHFLAYIIDGFIDVGESDFIRQTVKDIFSTQKKNGIIPAYPHVHWTCSVGLAQLAIVAYKLGMDEAADKAMDHLCSVQNPSGGFFGSYGLGANYFPKAEISWANKFFLDAIHLKRKSHHNEQDPGPNALAATPLDHQQWHEAITAGGTVEELAAKIKSNDFPPWCKPLLVHTNAQDVLLELGSGTGELSAICALYGRQVKLLDYSGESLDFAKRLFQKLGLTAGFHCHDILKSVPLDPSSVDWVLSSGVLEHFSDDQIVAILKDSKRLGRKGVMSLVPNARAIFYRIGKCKMEQEGTWAYGREVPKLTMRPLFEAAGLRNIREYSVGTYHTLQFWGSRYQDIKRFFDDLSPEELQGLNQGYLLFTIGTIQ